MNIKWIKKELPGKQYMIQTRTRMYLSRCFRIDKELETVMNNFSCSAVGLADCEHSIHNKISNHVIFLLNIERSNKKIKYAELFSELRKHELYVDDYPFGDILYDKLHALVLKLPEEFHLDMVNFQMGRYSELFKEYRNTLFREDERNSFPYKVVTKDLGMAREIKSSYAAFSEEYEFDQAPVFEEEVFNHPDFKPGKFSIVNNLIPNKPNWL